MSDQNMGVQFKLHDYNYTAKLNADAGLAALKTQPTARAWQPATRVPGLLTLECIAMLP